ncbi:unnamed protein product [Symbiodinium natans]|uniref:Uncharacterized protein n=1 Tax=Symbiodinium natans TaxID=878477 RepID=A0A812TGA9_9DINO|nr:unnamed protein product [Symbiodinium natans]
MCCRGFTGLTCEQPGNITEEEADIQPIILDDPNTGDPEDFWLHPCARSWQMWGDKPPVDPQVFAQMPPESADDFVPSPMMIVEGQFVCPPGYMLGDGPLFESDIESMEVGDCEIKCKNNDDCHFFWHGTQHSANTCRLYSQCENLLREPGVEGILKAVPRTPVCLVSNPEMCWTKSLRRYALTTVVPQNYLYWDLHAQCDYMLLLGGWGVSGCTRPSHRTLHSHRWKHKRLLPEEFAHGRKLKATCWQERYKSIRLGVRGDEVATCVSGTWISSSNLPGFGDFFCAACVQVGTSGFGDVETKRQQELYYFNKLALQLHSEVNPIADAKVNCMEPVRPAGGVETSLPEDLVKVRTFDLKGHDFTVVDNVVGQSALWGNDQASREKYAFQSLPEALVACVDDPNCWMVSRTEGTQVGEALRRFDMRKGNLVQFAGGKTWMKSTVHPCIGNCAALRPVKCGPGVGKCSRALVDGRKDGWLWTQSPQSGSHHCHQMKWVQVDLGAIKEFDQVKLYGYPDGWRKYCGHKIQVSNNENSWKTIYENHHWKNKETGKGITFNLGAQVGRYVRVFSSKSTANNGIHFLELEIFRAAVPQPKTPGSQKITSSHVKALKRKARKNLILQDGLQCSYFYHQNHCNVPDLGKLTAEHHVIVPQVFMENGRFPGIRQTNHFCVRCSGYLIIKKRGNYWFSTASDDGSLLYLDGHRIVDNNGCHGERERGSSWKRLSPGRHKLVVDMCEVGGGEALKLRYKGPDTGNHKITVPRSVLKYQKTAAEVELKDGAECDYFYGQRHCYVPNLDHLSPSHSVTVPDIYMAHGRFPGIKQGDHFCMRCTAQVSIQKEGNYKFTTASDDGSFMYLNGHRIVDNNGCHGERERTSGNQWLTQGHHLIGVDMCENAGGENMKLRYQGPDSNNHKVKVPSSALRHDKAGLECSYFYSQSHCWVPNLGRLHASHTVAVSEVWMEHGRFPGIRHSDHFCMRCSGYLVIKKRGHYHFTTASDDGSLLYINGHKIVDNNGCHGEREHGSHWIWLNAGKHTLVLDMCEVGGGEVLKLRYQGPDTGNRKITIPKSALLKPGKAASNARVEGMDTVTADFREFGTLKSGSRVAELGLPLGTLRRLTKHRAGVAF